MKKNLGILVCLILYSVAISADALVSVSVEQRSQVTDAGLTLAYNATYGSQINGLAFQQDIITSYKGYQYVTYYSYDRYVSLARRKLPSGGWEKIVFTDYRFEGDDAHNTISLGICPNDGTIHLAFDHHGENLHYRVSQLHAADNPEQISWTAGVFGRVTDTLETQPVRNLTYPAFLRTPQGDLQLIYRYGSSGDGVWKIYDYSGETHAWSNDRIFINASGIYSDSLGSSNSRCAYPNYYCYGPDGRLHVSWCWRESASGANHDIMYAFSNDRGNHWYNSKAIAVAGDNMPISDSYLVCDSAGRTMGVNDNSLIIKKLDRVYGMMNTQAQAVDSQGRPHIIMWHCTDETFAEAGYDPNGSNKLRWGPATARSYFHYWLDEAGNVHESRIPGYAGSRPKLFMRLNGDAVLVFQGCRDVPALKDEIYFTNGDLKVYAASADSKWTDWREVFSLSADNGYFMNEMLGDVHRFEESQTNILSILVQESPQVSRQSTAISVIDLELK